MLMYGVVWVSLIWMYWTEVRSRQVLGQHDGALAANA
jgi:NNP family nitrate/nitrite transporter-like MFS transporter